MDMVCGYLPVGGKVVFVGFLGAAFMCVNLTSSYLEGFFLDALSNEYWLSEVITGLSKAL